MKDGLFKRVAESMVVWLLVMQAAGSAGADGAMDVSQRQYTYSWLFADSSSMKPRGGTTSGPDVVLDNATSAEFMRLQASDLPVQERDRRAILAMAGDFRTSFDFIETVGFTEGYEPLAPYQSWGTERVYVLENTENFVSLQHIIVMHFVDDAGVVSAPMVVKHWRQDWRYQDQVMHEFQGRGRFQRREIDAASATGSWTQTVFQVDDSPRYEAKGQWTHAAGVSFWKSDDRRRPLPRREFSVRDDYQALYGSHRITITPSGWTQEEDTLKLVLADDNRPVADRPYLAREAGLSRYERLQNYNFSAGDAYWQKTENFWSAVRRFWQGVYKNESEFTVAKSVEGKPMYSALFALADQSYGSQQAMERAIQEALRPYIRAHR